MRFYSSELLETTQPSIVLKSLFKLLTSLQSCKREWEMTGLFLTCQLSENEQVPLSFYQLHSKKILFFPIALRRMAKNFYFKHRKVK